MNRKCLVLLLLLFFIWTTGCGDGASDDHSTGNDTENQPPVEDSSILDGAEGSGEADDGNETEVPQDIAYMLHLLETLKIEDVAGYSDNMRADTETIVPLINAAAKTYAGEIEMENRAEWVVSLHLTERGGDSLHNPKVVSFLIDTKEGIVDVSCRLDSDKIPSDHVCIRLYSEELWDYIFSLYNPGGIDQNALAEYGEILAERARQTMEYHNTTGVQHGFPAFTGFEIRYLRLADSFDYGGYTYKVYGWDAGFLTDDPDPGHYGWPQDGWVDEQNRVINYEWCSVFVAAWRHDAYEYEFTNWGICVPSSLYMRAQIIKDFTGEAVYLEGEPVYQNTVPITSISSLYTNKGVSIEIPDQLDNWVQVAIDPENWCYGIVMNPTYYAPLSEQTLFALYHTCEYWENGGGLIFSIRRYTEEEYGPMYLASYSRQRVFARDDNYYYCVFIPTGEGAVASEEALERYLRTILPNMIERNGWQAHTGEEDAAYPILSIPEEQSRYLDAGAVEIITDYVQGIVDYCNECGANPPDGAGSFTITEARITGIEITEAGTVGLTDGRNLYRLEYRLKADRPENVIMAGGMTMEDGWITERGSTGQPYLLLYYDKSGDEDMWKLICVTNTETIETYYATENMVKRYGNPYTAASVGLYQRYLIENGLLSMDEQVPTLPALPLTDEESVILCTAVMNNLKTGWWKGGVSFVACPYEAGAFKCVYREVAGDLERFYGYAGYFRFDGDKNCLDYWYAPAIITTDSSVTEVSSIWWPGDGAAYEEDIFACFPEEIAAFVAEPHEGRARTIRNHLAEIARTKIVPVTPPDVRSRISALNVSDSRCISNYTAQPGIGELVRAMRAAMKNEVEPDEVDQDAFFWSVHFYLTGGENRGSGGSRYEWVGMRASLEENIVEIRYHDPYSIPIRLYVNDTALYWMIRGAYQTEEYVDTEAFVRFGDILCERAQKTVDYSREMVDKYYPLPYFGYEIVYLKMIESFEKDGLVYEVYQWDAAFLHEDPAKVCWAGGMWLDSKMRVRDYERETYFVVCISDDAVEHGFFSCDLYFGSNEEGGREKAHAIITERFRPE